MSRTVYALNFCVFACIETAVAIVGGHTWLSFVSLVMLLVNAAAFHFTED